MKSRSRAMILAAGLGTRLKPLTDYMPKPLVPVLGKPMIVYVLEHLQKYGYTEAMVNVHYLSQNMKDFVQHWNQSSAKLRIEIQDESDKLLDSGGAIKRAGPWLFAEHQSALICNADVIAHPDLSALQHAHEGLRDREKVECTLTAMKHHDAGIKYNGMRIVQEKVIDFERPGKPAPQLFHFPGFYVLEKSTLARLPKDKDKFSIREDLWIPLAKEKKLGAWIYDGDYFDLGTPDDIRVAESNLRS